MSYLDPEALAAIEASELRSAKPYPWQSFEGLLNEAGHRSLLAQLPGLAEFRKVFGRRRRYGQRSHDRYALDYSPKLALPAAWREFVDELFEGPYTAKVAELLGHDDFFLTAHWHYTPRGCAVSPHCDAAWKLGSHIFYFNDERDWDPAWVFGAKLKFVARQILLHVSGVGGAGQRNHPYLLGKPEDNFRHGALMLLHQFSHERHVELPHVCRQERKTLIDDGVRRAKLTNLIIPAVLGKAAVLDEDGLYLGSLVQRLQLFKGHVRDAQQLCLPGSVDRFHGAPHFPVSLGKPHSRGGAMEDVRVEMRNAEVFQ